MATALWMLPLLLMLPHFSDASGEGFDVGQHLSTVSRYDAVKDIVINSSFVPSNAIDGCTPIHLNLVARHGTRSPTKKRMRELDRLASHLKELLSKAKEHKLSMKNVPAWMLSWESPWKGKLKGGELISQGEEELYDIGIRTTERFSDLFKEPYHPDVYVIKATQEASLLDITDQACGLFNPSEICVANLNLIIAEKHAPGSYEKARLKFAHAETVVPFSCQLGLFLGGSEFEKIQKELPLDLPPMPPMDRKTRSSAVAPFAGNNMLVLHSCPASSSNKYYIQVLHNERPIPMPGCGGSDVCPFEVFKERIVNPHLKHDYNALCAVPEPIKETTLTSKLLLPFNWMSWGRAAEPKLEL